VVTVCGGRTSTRTRDPHREPRARLSHEVLVLAAAFGLPPTWVAYEVEGPELVQAEDDFGFTVLGYHLAVGDRVEVLDPGLLGRVVRVAGGLPGLRVSKGDAFLAEQDARALALRPHDRNAVHPGAVQQPAKQHPHVGVTGVGLIDDERFPRHGQQPQRVVPHWQHRHQGLVDRAHRELREQRPLGGCCCSESGGGVFAGQA
jgi:hypothetical protein